MRSGSNSINNLNAPIPSVKSKKSGSGMSSSVQNVSNTSPMTPNNLNKIMSVQDNAITQRRLEYVETQLKKTQMEFKDHATKLQDFKTDTKSDLNSLGFVQEVVGTAGKNIISLESGNVIHKTGEKVHLVYPMKKDGNKTIMRAIVVDPVTAQFSYNWVVVFDMQSGKPIRPITNFRLP
tara:strand:- start:824 stop:1360 length:537 start_codon:yes stop_codon:yes gene_type:complete